MDRLNTTLLLIYLFGSLSNWTVIVLHSYMKRNDESQVPANGINFCLLLLSIAGWNINTALFLSRYPESGKDSLSASIAVCGVASLIFCLFLVDFTRTCTVLAVVFGSFYAAYILEYCVGFGEAVRSKMKNPFSQSSTDDTTRQMDSGRTEPSHECATHTKREEGDTPECIV